MQWVNSSAMELDMQVCSQVETSVSMYVKCFYPPPCVSMYINLATVTTFPLN